MLLQARHSVSQFSTSLCAVTLVVPTAVCRRASMSLCAPVKLQSQLAVGSVQAAPMQAPPHDIQHIQTFKACSFHSWQSGAKLIQSESHWHVGMEAIVRVWAE